MKIILRFSCTQDALPTFEGLLPAKLLRKWDEDSPAKLTTRFFGKYRIDTHIHNKIITLDSDERITDPDILITMMVQGNGTRSQLLRKVMNKLDEDPADAEQVNLRDRLGLTAAQLAKLKARIAPNLTNAQFLNKLIRKGKLIDTGIVWHKNVDNPVLILAGVE